MNYSLMAYGAVGILLLAALAWLSVATGSHKRKSEEVQGLPAHLEWNHIAYLAQIKQALSQADLEYVETAGSPQLARSVRRERKQVALTYLKELRGDFERLQRLARVLAGMSPEVEVAQELQGVRLRLVFGWRYSLIYLRLRLGIAPVDALSGLSEMFSGLTVRMEAAIQDLGERAAELTGPLEGRRLGAG